MVNCNSMDYEVYHNKTKKLLAIKENTHPILSYYTDNSCLLFNTALFSFKYSGRLWLDQKIISFWEYPETREKLNEIISDLNEIIPNCNIDNNWLIEVIEKSHINNYNNYVDKKQKWDNGGILKKVISIDNYSNSLNPTKKEREIHLLNPTLKRQILQNRGYKQKQISKNMVDAEYRHKSTRYKFTEGVGSDGFSYMSEEDESIIYNKFKSDIYEYIMNKRINHDAIVDINHDKYDYKNYIMSLFLKDILLRVRFIIKNKDYSTPEINNSFNNVLERVYLKHENEINDNIDKKIKVFFNNNQNLYIKMYSGLDLPSRISDDLTYILVSKDFNI